MAVDLLALVIGFVVGGLAVGIAVEVMGRGRAQERRTTKLTTGWRIRELQDPVLVARDVLEVDVPEGTRIYASGVVEPGLFRTCKVQQVPPVRAEFAFDEKQGRALLFLAGVRPGALGLLTVDPEIVSRLGTEARTLMDRAGDYVERLVLSEVPGRNGIVVETQGDVQDVLPFRERFMIRLQDGDAVLGVLVDKDPSGLREQRIQVRGRVDRDRTGYAVIEASDIRVVH